MATEQGIREAFPTAMEDAHFHTCSNCGAAIPCWGKTAAQCRERIERAQTVDCDLFNGRVTRKQIGLP